jgi:hypothetical protein
MSETGLLKNIGNIEQQRSNSSKPGFYSDSSLGENMLILV